MDRSLELSAGQYRRERIWPSAGDPYYLHLADLRRALLATIAGEPKRVLDFGCGGSPYRDLFAASEYLRADLAGASELDYVIVPGTPIAAPDRSVDMILSTQVLEHCRDPMWYLNEAFRLLGSGGQLVCTTHGMFEEHGCPDDYQRWTANGLKRDIERAGFTVTRLLKLTTGPRATQFMLERSLPLARAPRGSAMWFFLGCLRRLVIANLAWLHRTSDRIWSEYAVVDADEPGHKSYVAILAVGTRP